MKTPSKTTVETVKTVLIAILITGVTAFVAGMQYQASNTQAVEARVKAATVKNQ